MLVLFNIIPHLGQTTIYRNVMFSVSKKACRSYQQNASSDQTLQVMYVVTTTMMMMMIYIMVFLR
jgi:hypothetical protein